ncbi:MAG: hypothetical protein ACRECA_02080 [Pseudolabrys sp.]
MFGFRKRNVQKYSAGLIDDAVTWQTGFYKILDDNRGTLLLGTTKRDGFIIAAMANWVFRFGDYGPKISEDPSLKPVVDGGLKNIRRLPVDEDRTAELTLAVIIAAAAQNVPMTTFKMHFDELHDLGIVMKRINIHGLENKLADEHKPYYFYMQYGDL